MSTLTAAPSDIVVSLRVTATSTTSITIAWGQVPCKNRNVEITQYALIYIPISGGEEKATFTTDIKTNNESTITGLIPSTAYSIHVRADHINIITGVNFFGTMRATVNVITEVPESKVLVI